MVGIDLLVFEFEVGLNLVEDDPGLTFILFIAYSILLMLGLRFGYYANQNLQNTSIAGQRSIWRYLRYIGVLATLYGIVGVIEIITTIRIGPKNALLLGVILMLAFAIRQIHYTASADDAATMNPSERFVRSLFIGLVFGFAILVLATGNNRITAAIEGISAFAFLTYGVIYFQNQVSNARLQGTFLDSMLRHLLPVLAFAALVSILSLWITFGLERVVVLHVQVVFIIMTATALMTGTVKLRQNLAGL